MNQNVEAVEAPKNKRGRKRLAIVALPLAAIAIGAGAYAAWLASGTGESQDVTAGSVAANAIEVVKVTPAVTGLMPDSSKVSTFQVKNNASYDMTIADAGVLDATIAVSGGGPGCTDAAAADVTATLADLTGVNLPAGQTTSDAAFAVTVSMGPDSDNDCQGATFTPTVTVNAASS